MCTQCVLASDAALLLCAACAIAVPRVLCCCAGVGARSKQPRRAMDGSTTRRESRIPKPGSASDQSGAKPLAEKVRRVQAPRASVRRPVWCVCSRARPSR